MQLIHTATFEEISEGELRARFSTATAGFSNPMTEAEVNTLGYTILHETAQPAFDPLTQKCSVAANELVNGVWTQAWAVTALDSATSAAKLSEAQAAKLADIKAERDRRKFNGVLAGGKWIHSDVFSRTQWMGMVMMAGSLPAIQWKTLDGTFITTTPTLAGQVFQATAIMDATVFGVAEAHRAAMMALADPTGYDFSGMWPATFVPA